MTAGRVDPAAGDWRGPRRPYDLVKEFIVALVAVSLLTVVLALLFSSPNEKGVTLEQWAQKAPNDFIATTVSELAGTSTSASYGPPYNHSSTGQQIGPLHLQKWAGVRIPVDPARDFVISPLRTMTADAAVQAAVRRYEAAPAAQQDQWAGAYADALSKAPEGDPAQVAAGDYGPVPAMASGLLGLAQSGALDSQLVNAGTGFYQADYTKPLLFLADGGYLADLAQAQHLSGNQWGMMNETGNFPGQPWLWLYTFWYQVRPFSTSTNADALVWGLMMLLSLALVLVPFIPGVRSIPRRLPLYRLVWRSYYREHGAPRR
ncbi:MAG: hypothetical protein KGK07_14855 [Chloroflexota bacterium]|nr:hypothetical protein [Chloroflexota bacterium]